MFGDTNMTRTDNAGSQKWTAVSPFLELVSTVCNANQRANSNKLQNEPTSLVSGCKEDQSVTMVYVPVYVSQKAKKLKWLDKASLNI